MVFLAILSLVLGVLYGLSGIELNFLNFMSENTNIVLYILMFVVGISVGSHGDIIKSIKSHGANILLVPFASLIVSMLSGFICYYLTDFKLIECITLASGMGWYSLSGVVLGELGGITLGGVAFISNLMREVFSFAFIPIIIKYFNVYSAIACAGATSEDTTLPIIMKYSSKDLAIVSVVNGIVCSFFVPIIISVFLGG